MLHDSMIAWKAFPASNWLWKHFSLQKFVLMLERNGSQLARGQVNMADEAPTGVTPVTSQAIPSVHCMVNKVTEEAVTHAFDFTSQI